MDSLVRPNRKDGVVDIIKPGPKGDRMVFFAGKGGVGKTSTACATAVWLSRAGYRTLLLTTDPASHLSDVFEQPVTDKVRELGGLPGLFAARIDPKRAAEDYKQRILDDMKGKHSADVLAVVEEELDAPCTEEMATFDLFVSYASSSEYDVMVFDTAPTGHTLRLLQLPIEWSKQIQVKVYASVDSQQAGETTKAKFGQVIDRMRDVRRTTFSFIMYPEATPVVEAYRAARDIETLGISVGFVIANQVLPEEHCTNAYFKKRFAMQQKYLQEMKDRFGVPILQMPLLEHDVRGISTLIRIGDVLFGQPVSPHSRATSAPL